VLPLPRSNAIRFRYAPPGVTQVTTLDLLGYSDVDVITQEIRGRSLFFEIDLLEHIYLSVPRHGLFLDVGANIGNHSVYFAKFCADHVLAVEPHPKLLPILRRNLEGNASGRYHLAPFAVSASFGVGRMTLRPNFQGNVGGSQVQILSSSTCDYMDAVQVSTLDAVLSQFASLLAKHPLTLIKIDIEGMEYEALKGARKLITEYRPHLVIELATEDARTLMRSFLRDFGYQETGQRFGWTPTYHFIDPTVHNIPTCEPIPYRDDEVELLRQVGDEILKIVPEGESYILVDQDRLWTGLVVDRRRRFPFLERDGAYWGTPEDDQKAISELLRLKHSGARFIFFAEPAFWWLDYYQVFATYLREHARQILDKPRLRGYAL
jgi:FkbM family methyltransferase